MSLALVGTERTSGLKISAPVTPHGMYSTPLPSPLSEKDMAR